MQSKIQFFIFFFSLLCYSNAFNITSLLSQYPDFSTFNNYLTETQLAGAINSRQTITVLVVSNDAISPLSGKPQDVLKNILSVHVILDYFDVQKLETLPNKTQTLVTLFQASGQAVGQQGFLNATDLSTGSVVIGSAVKGATLGANVVKSIAAQPYNISVLQISTVIIPFGVDNSTSPAFSPTPATNSTSNSTSPSVSPVPAPVLIPVPVPAPVLVPVPVPTPAPVLVPVPVPAPVLVTVPAPVLVPVPAPILVPAPARSPRKALSPSPTPSNVNAPGLSPTPIYAPGSPPKPADVPGGADAPAEPKKSEGTAPRFGVLGQIIIVLCTCVCIGLMI